MNRRSRSVNTSVLAFLFNRVFSHRLKLGRLAAICAVLSLVVGGAWKTAAAQNGFTYAQRTLGSGFSNPSGVAVDASGNIFVADHDNGAVKKILAAGGYTTVNTVASGFSTPYDVVVDGSGNLFVTDSNAGGLYEFMAVNGSIPASPTKKTLGSILPHPTGLAVDGSGNVFVAVLNLNEVFEFFAVNGVVSTKYGQVGWYFAMPYGVAVDGSGNVFVANMAINTVAELLAWNPVDPENFQKTVASGFNSPYNLAIDRSGNIFVADSGNNAVKEIVAAGGYTTVKTVASGFNSPYGVAVDGSGNVFVADSGNNAVKEIMTGPVNFGSQAVGTTSTPVTMNFTIPAGAQVGSFALTTLGNKNMDFADAGSSTCTAKTYITTTNCVINVNFTPLVPGLRQGAISIFDGSGNQLASYRIYGTGLGPQVAFNAVKVAAAPTNPSLTKAMRVQADAQGNLFAAIWADPAGDPNSGSIMMFKKNGSSYNAGVAVVSGLSQPVDLALDGAGNLLVLCLADGRNDANSGAVLGIPRTVTGYSTSPVTLESGLNSPWGLAVDAKNDLFVSLYNNGQVIEYPYTGTGSNYGSPVTLASGLKFPEGLALDGSGNLFVALYRDQNKDPNSGSVVALSLSASGYGSPVTVATGLSYPSGVTVDTNDNVLVTSVMDPSQDLSSGAILEIPFTGSGFETPVTLASGMTSPEGVVLDNAGNIFFPDQGTNQFYELNRATAPSLSFASTSAGSTSLDSPQKISVMNIGNQPLNFSSVAYPTDFPEGSSGSADCIAANPLAANGACALTIDFMPTAANTFNESLVLTDNNLNGSNAKQSISLSGTGLVRTTTTLSSSLNPSVYGQTVTITATVAKASGSVTPTGTVQFSVDGNNVGSAVTLSGGTAAFSTSTLTGGTHSISAMYTPATGSGSGTSIATTLNQVVNQATPTVTWATPAAILYGTALSSTQLNATASVPGSFVYIPAAGTIQSAGNVALYVKFTPTDSIDYSAVIATVTLTVNNPAPVITSLSPAFTNAGGSAFTLTVTGSGFMPYTTIYWGSSPLVTQYVSATQLTAQVGAAYIANAGISTATVQTPTPGGGTSNLMQFEVDSTGSTTTSPTFTSNTTATVTAGSTASYPVTLPSNVKSISVTCLNLPAGATCNYNPTTKTVVISTSSTTPKGTYHITVIFTETVVGVVAGGILLPILLLPLLFIRRRLAARGVWITACLMLVLTAAAALSIGCSAGGFPDPTQMTSSGTVDITIQ